MVKKILIKMTRDFIALFLVFCGIDAILNNEIAIATNVLYAFLAASLKNMLTLKKYYQYKMAEQEIEMQEKTHSEEWVFFFIKFYTGNYKFWYT